jgi:putative ABC transport system substrate-binding protein
MPRRAFMAMMAGGLLAAPRAAGAQKAGKVWKIGVLWTSSPSLVSPAQAALRQGRRELGYVEGQNIAVEDRYAENNPERLRELAAELVRLRADVIVTQGTPAAKAAKEATRTVPIVMTLVGDPVGMGLISSFARPGGNVTGLSNIASELNSKRLALLKEAVPKLSRLAVLWDSTGSAPQGDPYGRRATEEAGRSLGLAVQILTVRGPGDFPSAFGAASKEHAEALLVLPSRILAWNVKPLVELAEKHQMPTMYQTREFVDAGGLMAYGASSVPLFARAAFFVDKILKGAKPADLPIEQPTKFELVINLKTAKALGLTIPPSLLQRADQVIE